MTKLFEKECIACSGLTPKLEGENILSLKKELHEDWLVIDEHHLQRSYIFKDFSEALKFTNIVGVLAEEQKHHPDIFLAWGKAKVIIFTHKIDGLTQSDFILAAKIDNLHEKESNN